ncbi:toxic protein SymE [Salmonella enterica]|uniref:hypothetical protein n=1 Tax=Salmonella enterica TaxID=28901 RepID=UPI00076BA4C7|nr:hypothetical protein [Salmonella enterica]GAR85152.1 toxic protein SymE [Salmonella enterica]
MPTSYTRLPSQHLNGDRQEDAGFKTGSGVTEKISQGCIVLMADRNEEQKLREQLYKAEQEVKGMRAVIV